jgi:hypothetical protein
MSTTDDAVKLATTIGNTATGGIVGTVLSLGSWVSGWFAGKTQHLDFNAAASYALHDSLAIMKRIKVLIPDSDKQIQAGKEMIKNVLAYFASTTDWSGNEAYNYRNIFPNDMNKAVTDSPTNADVWLNTPIYYLLLFIYYNEDEKVLQSFIDDANAKLSLYIKPVVEKYAIIKNDTLQVIGAGGASGSYIPPVSTGNSNPLPSTSVLSGLTTSGFSGWILPILLIGGAMFVISKKGIK